MMNKKLFKLLSTLIMAFSVLLTSCNSNSSQGSNSGNSSNNGGGGSSNTSHEHTFDDKWEYNDTYHWHSSTCGHDVKANEERHNFTSTVTDPTYEEGGYTTYTCSTCGYSYVDNETDKLEHNYSSSWSYDENSHWHACTDIGYEHLKKDESSHDFLSTVTDPTYEDGGYTTYTCSTCGYSYVDNETDKLEHNYSSSWSYDENSHWHACTDIGYEHLKKDESSHDFLSTVTDPTYEEGGYTTYTCSTCGYSYVDDKTDPLFVTITRKNYDGTILEVDNNVSYGTTPTYEGATPIKESDGRYKYTFAGWTPEVVIATKDATYTAVFSEEKITYTIDFDLNGGASSSYKGLIEVTTFSKDIFFFDCVKEDWQFRGWEYSGEKIFDEKGNQLKNVTLVDKMIFKAIYSQTVKLDITTNMPEAGTITGEGEYPYNTYVDVSVTPNQGYKFVGWYYQNTLLSNEENYKYMMWDKDVTLEARFEKDDFNLRIYSNNEDYGLVLLKSNSVVNEYKPEYSGLKEYGSEVTIAAYSKSDVRFLGWYDENNNLVTTNAVYTFVMPNYDYTLEAKWNYFTINYNLNGGTNDPDNADYYTLSDDIINLGNPTKEGYSFLGWKCNDEFIKAINPSEGKNITLEAMWGLYAVNQDLNGKYASIIAFDKTISDVAIPESIKVYGELVPVKVISNSVFENNDNIVSIIVPDSVTTIGDSAFSGCSNLETVTISENSQLEEINVNVFENCTKLTSIYIPNGVTTIKERAFYNCALITSINIPNNVTTIEASTFADCSSLTSINIPNSVTTIGNYAFQECSNLTTVTIEENSPLTKIETGVFRNCSSLTSIYIPSSVTTIGSEAFSNCSNLTTVTFGENSQLTTIGEYTFSNCSSLTSINIPDSVATIERYAFSNCSNLTIYCEASSKPSGWDSNWNYSDRPVVWSSYLGIHDNLDNFSYAVCLDGNDDKYIKVTEYIESDTYVVIPESINIDGEDIPIKEIGEEVFYNNENLISIIIPNSVTTIGESAFYGCSNLTTVTISENSQLTTIDSHAFYECSSLTSIYVPSGVTSISEYAFQSCSNLTTVTIGENSQLTTIEQYAFSNCSSLVSIIIPDSVTTIGNYAFKDCSNLTTVTIGENSQLTTIGEYAFYNCSSLTSIYIPSSVTTIGNYAFGDCSNLTTVTIGENSQLTTIGESVFSNCSSLASIYIPDSVTSIGESVFSNCSSLASIYIPDSVTSIGERAFYSCSNLTIYCEASSKPSGWDSWWNYSNRPVVWSSYNGIYGNLNGLEYIAYHDNEGNPYIVITGYNGSNTDVVIPEYINVNGEDIIVKTIADDAFYDNDTITSVIISDSITKIGSDAFYNCSSLTSIYIPSSVTTIGSQAFYNCSNLTTVTYGENSQLTTIGSDAFYNCSSLTSIYIPNSVTKIGSYAFYNCSNLTTVTFGENSQLTTIEGYAFYNCSSLTSIYIPNSITKIGSYAFYDCSNLTIYCEGSSQPSGWNSNWNPSNRPVVWETTYEEYLAEIE